MKIFSLVLVIFLLVSLLPTDLPIGKYEESTQHVWQMFRHDLNHTGRSPYDTSANPGRIRWTFPVGGGIESSPTIDKNETIYIGSDNGYLYAINNGTLLWKFYATERVKSSPALDKNGIIYVGSNDWNVYAIYPNGTEKWRFSTGNIVVSSPAIYNDTIYVGSDDTYIYAINSTTGKEKWKFKTNSIVRSSPAINSGVLFVGSDDSYVYAINASTGMLVWKYKTGHSVLSSPAIDSNGIIYVGSLDKKLYALNPNGTLRWTYTTGGYIYSSPGIGIDGTIYIGSDDGKLYAISPIGTLQWTFMTNDGIRSSPAIGSDGTVYIGSYDKNIYAIWYFNGTEKWSFPVYSYVHSSPAIGSDGTIYVGTGLVNPRLYAIKYNLTAPYSLITTPQNGAILKELKNISGKAYDDKIITNVKIAIKRLSDNNYWDGISWVIPEYWVSASGTTTWWYNSTNVLWDSGIKYNIRSKAQDNDGNIEMPNNGVTFTYDTTKPYSIITQPTNGAVVPSLSAIKGTANDNVAVNKVEISLRRQSDSHYWNGTRWITSEVWLLANGTSAWTYDTTTVTWTTNTQYTVRSKAYDKAGNIETPSVGNSFTYLSPIPSSMVTTPQDGAILNKVDLIKGTATDDVSVQKVEVSIKQLSDNHYWNGSAWTIIESWLLATGDFTWYYNSSGVPWVSDVRYNIRSRATDQENNVETPGIGNTFTFDNKKPTSSVTQPADGAVLGNLNVITGIASDNIEVKKVEVCIKRLSDNHYWDGYSWVNTEYWLTASGNTSWFYNSTSVTWQNGLYNIRSRATDIATNIEIPTIGNKFTFDTTKPYSTISYPLHNSMVGSVTNITGSASDNTGINKVEISLKRLTDSYYWDSTTWVPTETWLLTTGTTSWYYDSTAVSWDTDVQYTVRSKATDNANNVETTTTGNTFTIDNIKPQSIITYPPHNVALSTLKNITGKASDNKEVKKVEICIKRLSDNNYWDGFTWTITETWLNVNVNVSGKCVWWYNSTSVVWNSGIRYNIRSKAIDIANNVEIPTAGNTFTFDLNIPHSTITFPPDNALLGALNKITGTASDDVSVDKVEITIKRLSDNNYWNGTSWTNNKIWLPTMGTSTWSYNSSLVTWNMYIKYNIQSRAIDNANNIEVPTPGVTFEFDFSKPYSKIDIPIDNAVLRTIKIVEGTASDDIAVKKVELQIKRLIDNYYWNGVDWINSEIWLLASGTYSWSYNTSSVVWTSGVKYNIRSRAIDNANNIEIPTSGVTVIFDTTPPTSNVTYPPNNVSVGKLSKVSGTAIDNVALKKVEIAVRRLNDNAYWNGAMWVTAECWLATIGTSTWYYNVTMISWTSGWQYNIRSKSTDVAGNVETPGNGSTFKYDVNIPWSTLTTPTDGAILQKVSSIKGIAGDDVAVSKVEISLKRLSDNTYWDGTGWVTPEIWLLATGTSSWTYSSISVVWTSGVKYNVRSKATDNANNVEIPSSGVIFWIDNTPPSSTITYPLNNTAVNNISFIKGRAYDNVAVKSVEISICRLFDKRYWNGTHWVNNVVWLQTTGNDSWSYNATNVVWDTGYWYNVKSCATDFVNMVETPGPGSTFIFDSVPPSSKVTHPPDGVYISTLVNITGTSNDNVAVKNVRISIKRLSDNYYWDGKTWCKTESWLPAKGTTSWWYDSTSIPFSSGQRYNIRSQATDTANNSETVGVGNSFTIDFTMPTSTVTEPQNNSVINTLRIIKGTARDDIAVKDVDLSIKRLSDNCYWNGSCWAITECWLSTIGTTTWTYNSTNVIWHSNQSYNIRSRAIDIASNIEVPSTGISFRFDNVKPISEITCPMNSSIVNKLNSIKGRAKDDTGINEVKISIRRVIDNYYWNGKKWVATECWLLANGTYFWSYDSSSVLWTSDYTYNIRSYAVDLAGNIESIGAGSTFVIDMIKPSSEILYPIDKSIVNRVDVIKGIANDNIKLQKVEIAIIRTNDNFYWDGKKWIDKETWLTANGTEKWSYNSISVSFALGNYTIYSKSIDCANNVGISSGNTFRFDSTQPYSTITYPLNGSVVAKLSAIRGIATDDTAVRTVEILITRIKDKYHWNGSTWSKSECWLPVSGTLMWSYNSTLVTWNSGDKYIIQSKAIDVANNTEQLKPGNTFTFDTEKPRSLITVPSNNASLSKLTCVKGIGFDNVGIKRVEISIKRLSDNYQWDGMSWSKTEKWLTVSGTTVWSYNTSNVQWSIGSYSIRSVATDLAENKEPLRPGITFRVVTAGKVEGIVNDTFSKPISDVIITVNSNSAKTDSKGHYKIENVEPGVYNITASKYGYLSQTKKNIHVFSNKTTYVDFVLQPATGYLIGRVVDERNRPLEDVSVIDILSNKSILTSQNGSFILTDIPAGERVIEFMKLGYMKVRRNVTVVPNSIVDMGTITMYSEKKFQMWMLLLILLIVWIIVTAIVVHHIWKPVKKPEISRCLICYNNVYETDYVYECECKSLYHHDCAVNYPERKCVICGKEFDFSGVLTVYREEIMVVDEVTQIRE